MSDRPTLASDHSIDLALGSLPLTASATMAVQMLASTDLLAQMRSQVARAASRLSMGEDVAHAVSLTVIPGQEPGSFIPVIVVVLTLPAATIGERSFATHVIMDLHLGQEAVDGLVAGLLEAMRNKRSADLGRATV